MDFAAPKLVQTGENSYDVSYGDSRKNAVEFYWEEQIQTFLTEQEGRLITKKVAMIDICTPGDRTKKIRRAVKMESDGSSPSDIELYPKQWEAFQRQQVQIADGTALDVWPPLSRSQVTHYKSLNVHTVEQLGALSDLQTQNLGMGGRELRDKARAWLENAKTMKPIAELTSRLDQLANENEALKNQLAMMGKNDYNDANSNDASMPPKRKGRPPKNDNTGDE